MIQPVSMATRPCSAPTGAVSIGTARRAARAGTRGKNASSAARVGARWRSTPVRRRSCCRPLTWYTYRKLASCCTMAGIGKSPCKQRRCTQAPRREPVRPTRASARPASSSLPNSTPAGHAVSHARQPRQKSSCVKISPAARTPSATDRIRSMRPRGEAASWPVRR